MLGLLTAGMGWGADPDQSFAGHLLAKQEYQWAFLEYERLLCAFPDSSAAPLWRYREAVSLMHLGRFDLALGKFSVAAGASVPADSARLNAAYCALRLKRHGEAALFLDSCRLDYSRLLRAYLDFSARRFAAALDTLKAVPTLSVDAFKARAFEQAILDAQSFGKKHYAPALALSLVPGLGHVYAGRKGDGLMSAITIATGGLVTGYYAYHESRTRAYAAGTITGLFYAGSIYGAAVSVKIHNREGARRSREAAERIVFGQ
jgi:tetratricopeptide (TPR) repeat protein